MTYLASISRHRVGRLGLTIGTLLVGAVLTLAVQRVRAAGVPATGSLSYSGQLALADGTPVNGTKNIGLALWDAAVDGNRVCDVISSGVAVVAGRFRIQLPDACVAAIKATPDLWIDVQVEGGSAGRAKLGAVPYAIEAGAASSASGALNTRISTLETAQGTLSGNANAGYLQSTKWGNSVTATSLAWTTLWGGQVAVPVNSVLNVSVNGHWIVDKGYCYLAVAVDGVSLAEGGCDGYGDTTGAFCTGGAHTYLTSWAPVGYAATGTIAAGNHTLDVQVRPSVGTTCSLNGARLYWSTIPK